MKIIRVLCLFFGFSVWATAQQLDNPVTIPVSYYGEGINSATNVTATLVVGSQLGAGTSGSFTGPGGQTFTTPVQTVYLVPGKTYSLTISSSNCAVAFINFVSVNGCRVFLNGYQTNKFTQGSGPYTVSVRLERGTDGDAPSVMLLKEYVIKDALSQVPETGSGQESSPNIIDELKGTRGGASTAFPENRASWYLSLGNMRNGKPAGALGFSATDITAALGTTAGLIYDSPAPDEVAVNRIGGYITSIVSRDVTVEVDPYNASSTSYEIRVKTRGASTPFLTYKVSYFTISGGSALRIDRLENDDHDHQWTTQIEKTANQWVRYDWQRVGTGLSAINSGLGINTSGPKATTVISGTAPNTTETVTYGDVGGVTLTKIKTFISVNGRQELQTQKLGGSSSTLATTYEYYTSNTGTGWTGAIKSITEASGNWTKFDYFNGTGDSRAGLVSAVYRPWKDSPSTPATATSTNCSYESYAYTTSYDGTQTALSSVTSWVNGAQVGYTTKSYNWSATGVNNRNVASTTTNNYSSAAAYLSTISKEFRHDDADSILRGKPFSLTNPDGTRVSYAYFHGSWDAANRTFSAVYQGPARLELVFRGHSSSSFGGNQLTNWTIGTYTWGLDPIYVLPNLSTVTEIVYGEKGQVLFTAENLYTSNGTLERVSGTEFEFDGNNLKQKARDIARSVPSGPVESTFAYQAGLLKSQTNAEGVPTVYDYNSFLQTTKITTGDGFGQSTLPKKEQNFTYYEGGMKNTSQDCSCSPVATTYYYDNAGRISSVSEPKPGSAGNLVTSYSYNPNNRITTITSPNAADSVTERYLDGSLKSVTGTGVVSKYYDYNIVGGNRVSIVRNDAAGSNGWQETTSDWLGRNIALRVPHYDWSTTSTSRVNRTESSYNSTTGKLTSITLKNEANVDALLMPRHIYEYGKLGMLVREGDDVDNTGTLSDASIDRITKYDMAFYKEGTWNGWIRQETVSVLRTDNNSTDIAQITNRHTRLTRFNNGQISGTSRAVGDVVSFDASGKYYVDWEWIDPVTRTRTQVHVEQGISNAANSTWTNGYLSSTQTMAGMSKSYSYNTAGLIATETEGVTNASVSYNYHSGTKYIASVARTTGSSTSSYETFEYSWSTANKSSIVARKTNLSSLTDTGGQTIYQEYNALGLLRNIWGSGTQPSQYGYDAYGRRTSLTTWTSTSGWNVATFPAPNGGNTTSWTPDPATGLVKTKTYADGKSLTYTYNPRGQLKTRTTSRGLLTTYNYFDTTPSFTGELQSVVYNTGSGITTPNLSFTYTRFGALATVTDFTGTRSFIYRSDLKPSTETLGSFYSNKVVTLNYDTTGRPSGYSFNGTGATISQTSAYKTTSGQIDSVTGVYGGVSTSFTFAYHNGTNLVNTATSGAFVRTMEIGQRYNAILEVKNTYNGSNLGSFKAIIDPATELQTNLQSGQTNGGNAPAESWSQLLGLGDGINQVIGYNERDEVTTSATPTWLNAAGTDFLSTRNFGWQYDNQGNRTTQTGALTLFYTPNGATNQYTSITGEAGLAYDNDGNMTADGSGSYKFDHENRLIQVVSGGNTTTYTYDYLNRRVRKQVSTGSDVKFVWTGWTLIADVGSDGATPLRSYVWGPDLSDNRGAAGGAGALLAQHSSTAAFKAMIDRSGNVVGYINDIGEIVAAMEFGQAGQKLDTYAKSGFSVDGFSMWYASNYREPETEFVYYGMRYYQPKHGRFINRDPIEEAGGNNLYAFCSNRGANGWDVLGLDDSSDEAIELPPMTTTGSVTPWDRYIHVDQWIPTLAGLPGLVVPQLPPIVTQGPPGTPTPNQTRNPADCFVLEWQNADGTTSPITNPSAIDGSSEWFGDKPIFVPPRLNIEQALRDATQMTPSEFFKAVNRFGDWDFKRTGVSGYGPLNFVYESFGNFWFGASGNANRWDINQLLIGGGMVSDDSKWSRGSSPSTFGLPGKAGFAAAVLLQFGAKEPFNDSWGDNLTTKAGYSAFGENYSMWSSPNATSPSLENKSGRHLTKRPCNASETKLFMEAPKG